MQNCWLWRGYVGASLAACVWTCLPPTLICRPHPPATSVASDHRVLHAAAAYSDSVRYLRVGVRRLLDLPRLHDQEEEHDPALHIGVGGGAAWWRGDEDEGRRSLQTRVAILACVQVGGGGWGYDAHVGVFCASRPWLWLTRSCARCTPARCVAAHHACVSGCTGNADIGTWC